MLLSLFLVAVDDAVVGDVAAASGAVFVVLVKIFFFFFFFFCQAHRCGAFIQKHSSIVTVFLSLTHSHVFV